jgi:hypothetical protein
MTIGYVKPFSFTISPSPTVQIASVRHGVTEINLSDGRQVRVSLHVKEVKPNAGNPKGIDIAYDLLTEVMPMATVPVLDAHETVQ